MNAAGSISSARRPDPLCSPGEERHWTAHSISSKYWKPVRLPEHRPPSFPAETGTLLPSGGGLSSKSWNSSQSRGRGLVVDSETKQGLLDLGTKLGNDKDHGLAEIAHSIFLEETGISIGPSVILGRVTIHESVQSIARRPIRAIYVPRDNPSRLRPALFAFADTTHCGLSNHLGPSDFPVFTGSGPGYNTASGGGG